MKACTQSTVASKPEFKRCSGPQPFVAALATLLLLLRSALWATNYTVQMTEGLIFTPATLSIGQPDSVTWTNVSVFPHTTTSGNAPNSSGLWNSGTVNAASSFTVSFTNFATGTYPYFCSFHWLEGMKGSLMITNSGVQLPVLSDPSWKTNQFQFILNGTAGQSYITETSSNLANWFAISTNLAGASRFTITDPTASNHSGFYRVRQGQ
jgi:plastocyanin